jgi:hypothetical protein
MRGNEGQGHEQTAEVMGGWVSSWGPYQLALGARFWPPAADEEKFARIFTDEVLVTALGCAIAPISSA